MSGHEPLPCAPVSKVVRDWVVSLAACLGSWVLVCGVLPGLQAASVQGFPGTSLRYRAAAGERFEKAPEKGKGGEAGPTHSLPGNLVAKRTCPQAPSAAHLVSSQSLSCASSESSTPGWVLGGRTTARCASMHARTWGHPRTRLNEVVQPTIQALQIRLQI